MNFRKLLAIPVLLGALVSGHALTSSTEVASTVDLTKLTIMEEVNPSTLLAAEDSHRRGWRRGEHGERGWRRGEHGERGWRRGERGERGWRRGEHGERGWRGWWGYSKPAEKKSVSLPLPKLMASI